MYHGIIDTFRQGSRICFISQFFHRVQFRILGNSHNIIQISFCNIIPVFCNNQVLLCICQFHFTAQQVHFGHYAYVILSLYIFQVIFQG